jgi:hypothetical protein
MPRAMLGAAAAPAFVDLVATSSTVSAIWNDAK